MMVKIIVRDINAYNKSMIISIQVIQETSIQTNSIHLKSGKKHDGMTKSEIENLQKFINNVKNILIVTMKTKIITRYINTR